MPYRYVPMLRSKSGEVTAIERLAVQARNRLFPVVHLVARPPNTFVQRLAAVWDLPLAIDGLFNFSATGTTTAFVATVNGLRAAGLIVSPSTETDVDPAYAQAVGNLVTARHPYVVVKVPVGELAGVGAWVASRGWTPNNVDLVISAGYVAEYPPRDFAAFVAHSIRSTLPLRGAWRSITLASASAPKDYSGLAAGRNEVPRRCWALWQNTHNAVEDIHLDFGDYAIAHPDLQEPPGVAMVRASVSVRYAVDDNWIVLKGRPTTGASGRAMGTQYLQHAQALLREPQFDQVPGCWADNRISTIANAQTAGSGSRQSWIEIGVNRHLSLVADRLP